MRAFVVLVGILLGIAGLAAIARHSGGIPPPPATNGIGSTDVPTDTPHAVADVPPPPMYLGARRTDIVARLGNPNTYGGYGVCANYPGFDLWKIAFDSATDRVTSIGVRPGCDATNPAWRDWIHLGLPPDAVLLSETPDADNTILQTYRSDWLQIRVGCGTIRAYGSATDNTWKAYTWCF